MVAMTRTSTAIGAFDPRRVTVPVSSTLSNRACTAIGNLVHIVEQQRAAMSPLEHAGAILGQGRERAAHVPEDLGFEKGFAEGRATD